MEKYKRLLDITYELEGLLLRALSGKEASPRLASLIEEKIKAMGKEGAELPAPAAKVVSAEADSAKQEEEKTLVKSHDGFNSFYALEDDEDERPALRQPRGERRQECKSKRGKPVFSLNDRFLFLRELFGGDAVAFNRALERIAASEEYEEASLYLENECGLNPEGETAAQFLEVIEAYFKNQH